ncbi:polysaccharide deacetylase [Opitutaceae bacterium TAV5]|nr:polysaccharide deacetylase [Opitutaceae bacterium TAV5]
MKSPRCFPFLSGPFLFAAILLFAGCGRLAAATPPTPEPTAAEAPLIVLKLDDMRARDGKVPAAWQRVVDFAVERKIKISVGIICNSLAADNPDYIAGLKKIAATGLVEFWHHGYTHGSSKDADGGRVTEFSRSSYEKQRDSLLRGMQLAQEKLGVTFVAFGAPFNATDATTARVLSEIPEIRVWLYGNTRDTGGKFVARRVGSVNIENPVHKPNLSALVKGFEAAMSQEPRPGYFVLQGHAGGWDDEKFAEFVRIVDYLTEQGCKFVFPSELPLPDVS